MTIKRQFFFLGTLIITIPIVSILYLGIFNYISSPTRLILHGTEELDKISKLNLSPEQSVKYEETIKRLPSGVEFIIHDTNYQIIVTNIEGFNSGDKLTESGIWEILKIDSKDYFYQISSIPEAGDNSRLITRVPREQQTRRRRTRMTTSLIIILFVIVFICTFILIKIFSNISHSITKLEEKTQEIAKGNLSIELQEDYETINKDNSKTNEITSLFKSIETMRNSLIEAQSQKNKFIMGMSHDLRTPVAVIKGYTEALSDGVISDKKETKQALELINTKTEQLEGMIDTLINFTKLNNQNLKDMLLPESITAFIKDFANEAQNSGNVFNRKILSSIDLPDNITITMNKQLASRAFENLFSNALRYTKTDDTIALEAYFENSNIYFKIKDTGCGIPPKDIKNIFNMFYRGTNSRREEGMGIGLAVVKNIMDTHGWDITVESEVGKGSCFTIIIPVEE